MAPEPYGVQCDETRRGLHARAGELLMAAHRDDPSSTRWRRQLAARRGRETEVFRSMKMSAKKNKPDLVVHGDWLS